VTFLDPLAGLAGLAGAAIVALYFLKARRPPLRVPSTLWWRPRTEDRQASVPWQRLRPSRLLALQLLAAALVIGALLQPALPVARALTGQTIVVIDTSETMQATDVAPSRFAAAVSYARSLVGRLAPGARMTIIDLDASPSVVASSESQRQPLLDALSGLRVTSGPADLQEAAQLAVAAAGPATASTQLVVVSDGITEPLAEPLSLPFPVQYHLVGVGAENVGITSLDVVPGLSGADAVAHLEDYGQLSTHVTLELWADGSLVAAAAAKVAAGQGDDVSLPVPPGTAYVHATLSPSDDLAADDSAWAVVSPPRPVRILLVTEGDVFLKDALELRPDALVNTELPSRWTPAQANSSAWDLFVFDRFVPAELPATTPFLVVGPPPDKLLGTGPPLNPGVLLPAEADDPLLADVDLSDVDVALSADMSGSHFGRVVIASPAGPVLMVRDPGPNAPPAAVLGIYLHDSDLVLRDAFPVLLTHLSQYLAPSTVPAEPQVPGEPVVLGSGPGAVRVVVTRPDGRRDSLVASGSGTVLFADTAEPGLYEVTVDSARGLSQTSYLAVNAPGASIAPVRQIELSGATGSELRTAPSYRAIWPWLAVAALFVLLLEWAAYHRAT